MDLESRRFGMLTSFWVAYVLLKNYRCNNAVIDINDEALKYFDRFASNSDSGYLKLLSMH